MLNLGKWNKFWRRRRPSLKIMNNYLFNMNLGSKRQRGRLQMLKSLKKRQIYGIRNRGFIIENVSGGKGGREGGAFCVSFGKTRMN